MDLPEKITMRNTAHGHGAKGMAFYSYEDAHGLDVFMDARRKTGRDPFIETWRYRWLPMGEFASYEALRAAVAGLTSEQVTAEKAKWPQMPEPPRPSDSRGYGTCWLHTDRPRTHSGWVQTCWHDFDGLIAMLCEECAGTALTDPGVIVRASTKRIADCATREAKEALAKRPASSAFDEENPF